MLKVHRCLLLIPVVLLLGSCKKVKDHTVKSENEELNTANISPKPAYTKKAIVVEDFEIFYHKFHMDSMFQMARIKFPLQGYEMDTAEIVQGWDKENWVMHRAKISEVDTTIYKVKIEKDEYKHFEKVYIEGGGFNLERVFKRIKGQWYLTSFVNEEM